MRGRAEQALVHACRSRLEAVAGEAKADDRIVVRPHRAVVIRHRVIASLALGDRADPPPAERLPAHQGLSRAAGPLWIGDPGKQRVAGVGGANPAGPLRAVESKRVGPDVRAPERLLKPIAHILRFAAEPQRKLPKAEPGGHRRKGALGGVDVALDLAQRDRSLGERAVGVEDGVVGVLPSLIGEAAFRLAVVLDEAVSITVAMLVDPSQCRLDAGPD